MLCVKFNFVDILPVSFCDPLFHNFHMCVSIVVLSSWIIRKGFYTHLKQAVTDQSRVIVQNSYVMSLTGAGK